MMHLAAFVCAGPTSGSHAGWRHPAADRDITSLGLLHPPRPDPGGRLLRLRLPRRYPCGAGPSRRQHGQPASLRRAGRAAARSADRARRDVRGDAPCRPRLHRLHHLFRAVRRGARAGDAGSPQRRPRRVEHRHLVPAGGSAQFRPRGPALPQRTLRPRRRIHGGRLRAVGFLERRCAGARSRRPAVRRSRESAAHRPRRALVQGARPAQRQPLAAGPAGVPAGRRVRSRARLRGALGGGGVRDARGARGRARIPPTTCGRVPSGSAASPTISRCCPASCRSSPRPGRWPRSAARCWTASRIRRPGCPRCHTISTSICRSSRRTRCCPTWTCPACRATTARSPT